MKKYNFSNCTVNCISSLLTSRKQSAVVNRVPPSLSKVVCGVPKVSVLGPVLLLVFINDLPNYVECFVKLFADDTKLYFTANSSTDCNHFQHDIGEMNKWSDCWLLMLNVKKCKVTVTVTHTINIH